MSDPTLKIIQFPCLSDNYGYLIHDSTRGLTAAIDTPDAAAINVQLESRGWRLTHILNTHHHHDHVGGNRALKQEYDCVVVGPRADRDRIPALEIALGDGDYYDFGNHRAQIFDVPGHTRGHIAYWFASDRVVFVGDTLFSLGCGRLFEGTPAQMWRSLGKLKELPGATKVYCAHEYTQANARFAITIDPGNLALIDRCREIDELRAAGQATIPTSISLERATNPFLRADDSNIAEQLGMSGGDPVAIFAEIRRRKDRF